MRERKYRKENLIPMFLKTAALRNEMRSAGFTNVEPQQVKPLKDVLRPAGISWH